MTPQRQIRALYDETTITVYQAYSSAIALPAAQQQRLDASSEFKVTRMTWIKPSWCWMLYRAGYSYKDAGQERILALRIPHQYFLRMLRDATLSTDHDAGAGGLKERNPNSLRIQWDPERDFKIGRLEYRSIQIGIPAARCKKWVEDGIVGIDDVTEKAKELKRAVDTGKGLTVEELKERGLVPEERVYEVPADVRKTLKMNGT